MLKEPNLNKYMATDVLKVASIEIGEHFSYFQTSRLHFMKIVPKYPTSHNSRHHTGIG